MHQQPSQPATLMLGADAGCMYFPPSLLFEHFGSGLHQSRFQKYLS
jgi:hypothetical protein